MKKSFCTSLLPSLMLFSSIICLASTEVKSATLEKFGEDHFSIHLDNVEVFDTVGSSMRTAATIVATDDDDLHVGQVFQLAGTDEPFSVVDAAFDQQTGELMINFLADREKGQLHHVKFIQSGSEPLQFT